MTLAAQVHSSAHARPRGHKKPRYRRIFAFQLSLCVFFLGSLSPQLFFLLRAGHDPSTPRSPCARPHYTPPHCRWRLYRRRSGNGKERGARAAGKRGCFVDLAFATGITATGLHCKARSWVNPKAYCAILENEEGGGPSYATRRHTVQSWRMAGDWQDGSKCGVIAANQAPTPPTISATGSPS